MLEKIKARITTLEAERERVLAQLNEQARLQLAPYDSALGELRVILADLEPADKQEPSHAD